jgi:hypothetical protein
MCNLESDPGSLLDGHLRLDKAPVQAHCPNQSYFDSSRVEIGQFDDATKMVSRCPTPAVDWCLGHHNILDWDVLSFDQTELPHSKPLMSDATQFFLLAGSSAQHGRLVVSSHDQSLGRRSLLRYFYD